MFSCGRFRSDEGRRRERRGGGNGWILVLVPFRTFQFPGGPCAECGPHPPLWKRGRALSASCVVWWWIGGGLVGGKW